VGLELFEQFDVVAHGLGLLAFHVLLDCVDLLEGYHFLRHVFDFQACILQFTQKSDLEFTFIILMNIVVEHQNAVLFLVVLRSVAVVCKVSAYHEIAV